MADTKKAKVANEEKEKERVSPKDIVDNNGEYGTFATKTGKFTAVTNFILRVDALVVEDVDDGEVLGFLLSAKPKNNRVDGALDALDNGWLDSVFMTRRDMGDKLYILTTNNSLLPGLLKNLCDEYEKSPNAKKMIPVKKFGLQEHSQPPVWVLNEHMQLVLKDGKVTKLVDSPYTILCGDNKPPFEYCGDIDSGESLSALLLSMHNFFGNDMPAALLVLGGTAMSFHYNLLSGIIGGVPCTLAIGDPISGKSTAVAASLSVFDQRDSIGAGSEAKLMESLRIAAVPQQLDDFSNLSILEKIAILLFNKSKKVTLTSEVTGNTLPVITMNYTKLLAGFKRFHTPEDFGRFFTRLLPIPFAKKTERTQSISERIDGRNDFEQHQTNVAKSVGIMIKLHDAYLEMTKDALFGEIDKLVQQQGIDVRSESNYAVLLYSTGKILEYIGLKSHYWEATKKFFVDVTVPKYKELLKGKVPLGAPKTEVEMPNQIEHPCESALRKFFAWANPDKANKFMRLDITPTCDCGQNVSFNVNSALTSIAATSMSAKTFCNYVKQNALGCTSKHMRIGHTSVGCVHLSREKLERNLPGILLLLDGDVDRDEGNQIGDSYTDVDMKDSDSQLSDSGADAVTAEGTADTTTIPGVFVEQNQEMTSSNTHVITAEVHQPELPKRRGTESSRSDSKRRTKRRPDRYQ